MGRGIVGFATRVVLKRGECQRETISSNYRVFEFPGALKKHHLATHQNPNSFARIKNLEIRPPPYHLERCQTEQQLQLRSPRFTSYLFFKMSAVVFMRSVTKPLKSFDFAITSATEVGLFSSDLCAPPPSRPKVLSPIFNLNSSCFS